MKYLKRNEGIATIWMAIAMLMLVGFVGLAVDVGLTVWTGQQLQIAADGAALAGAQFVRSDPVFARDQAQLVGVSNVAAGVNIELDRNAGNVPGGDIVFGRFDRDTGTFDPTGAPNAVQVNARRTAASANGALDLLFGSALGMDSLDMQRSAIAILGGGTGTGMLILDNDERCALTIRGNPTVNLFGGAIQVNSSNPEGTCLQGSPDIIASEFNLVGSFDLTGVTEDEVPPLNEYQPEIADPLADLPDPEYDEDADLGGIDAAGTYEPGYYSEGIDLSKGTVVLNPGVYILGGAGIDIRGSTTFTAEGVMLFILEGPCNINGTGDLTITPPDPDNPDHNFSEVSTYEGVAIFQARTNTTAGTVVGTADMNFEGTYYFPNNKISLGGTSNQFGNQFIAWQAEIFGNGLIELAVDGSIPAPGRRVFLVR